MTMDLKQQNPLCPGAIPRTACVIFIDGCPRSEIDASLIVGYFKRNGWIITDRFREADLILLGTCGVTREMEEKCLRHLSIISSRKQRSAEIVVFGCLPGINGKRIVSEFKVRTITPQTLDRLDEMVMPSVRLQEMEDPNILEGFTKNCAKYFTVFDRFRVKCQSLGEMARKSYVRFCLGRGPQPLWVQYDRIFNLRVAKGCTGECSFCAVRFAEGSLCSSPLHRIVAQFEKGLSEGFGVFRLVANDVGEYGQDVGANIVELLKALFDHRESFRLMWDDFSPRWLIRYFPELFDIFVRNVSRVAYVGFPVQSGSERMVTLMKRFYTVAETEKSLMTLQRAFPSLDLTTHVMVGFPGERDRDFIETIEFLRKVNFRHFLAYTYSDRPETLASQLPDKIPEEDKRRRVTQLRKAFPRNCAL